MTLYFYGAVSGHETKWSTQGNWFTDHVSLGGTHTTVAASSLPADSDDLIFLTAIDCGAVARTCSTAVFPDKLFSNGQLTCPGGATFNGGAWMNTSATLVGNVIFNEVSNLVGTVTGNATFNASSTCSTGIVSGAATFNGTTNATGTFGSVIWGSSAPAPCVNGWNQLGYDAAGYNADGYNAAGYTSAGYPSCWCQTPYCFSNWGNGSNCWGFYANGYNDGGQYSFDLYIVAYGWSGSTYYIAGYLTGLDYNGTGYDAYNGYYYINGNPSPLDNTGTGYDSWYTGTYYILGVATSLDSSGDGDWNGGTYIGGVLQGGGSSSGPVTPSRVLLPGLVAHWKLDETSGTRVDSTSNHYNLSEQGGTVGYALGKLGNAAHTSGSNYFSNTAINVAGDLSVSLWVKTSVAGSGYGYYSFLINPVTAEAGDSSNAAFVLYLTDAGVATLAAGGGGMGDVRPVSTSPVNDGAWHQLTGIVANGQAKLYVDGALVDTKPTSYTGALPGITVGANSSGNFGVQSEDLDSISIWNRALTDGEVAGLYNNGTGLEYENFLPEPVGLAAGLLAHWALDEVSGTRYEPVRGYNLTDNNGVGYTAGKLGNAAQFNGNKLTATGITGITDELTVAFWHKFSTNINGSNLLSWSNSGLSVFVYPSSLAWNTSTDTSNKNIITTPVADEWHYVAIRLSAVSQGVSLDGGTFSVLSPATIPDMTGELILGEAVGYPNNYQFFGALDSVSIWNRALTDDEVAGLYNNGAGLNYASYWGTASLALDILLSGFPGSTTIFGAGMLIIG